MKYPVLVDIIRITYRMTGREQKLHTCTFAGHSFVFSATVEDRLRDEIESYLADIDGASFYVGGRGEFDGMAAAAVRVAKARHKD